MLEHDAERLVSDRKRAGDSDDEIVRLLTERGVAEDHAEFLVATVHLVPDDPAEFAGILQQAGWDAPQAWYIAQYGALWQRLIEMLTATGLDEDAAAKAVTDVMDSDDHPAESFWKVVDLGATEEAAYAMCLGSLEGQQQLIEDALRRQVEGRQDVDELMQVARDAASPKDLAATLNAKGLDDKTLDSVEAYANATHMSMPPLAEILARGRPRRGLGRLLGRRRSG